MKSRKLGRAYDDLKDIARRHVDRGRTEAAFLYILAAARSAYLNHLGIWADRELDALLERAAGPHVPPASGPSPSGGPVIGVASALTATGGHGYSLLDCLDSVTDPGAGRRVILTEINNAVSDAGFLERGRGEVRRLPFDKPYGERIADLVLALRALAPSAVVMAVSPYDIVACAGVARYKRESGVRVYSLDHADHTFGLGADLPDFLLEFRPYGELAARRLRGYAGRIAAIHYTARPEHEAPSAPRPRLSSGKTSSVSVGTALKIVDDGRADFFAGIRDMLYENPGHAHTLLTTSRFPSGADARAFVASRTAPWPPDLHARFIVHFDRSDTVPFYREADFLIETYPVGGGIVLMEAMAHALPVVFFDNPLCRFAMDAADPRVLPKGYPFVARSSREAAHHAGALIRDPALRARASLAIAQVYRREFSRAHLRRKLRMLFMEGIAAGFPSLPHHPESDAELNAALSGYLLQLDLAAGGGGNPYFHLYASEHTRPCYPLGRLDALRLFARFGPRDFAFLAKDALTHTLTCFPGRVAARLKGRGE